MNLTMQIGEVIIVSFSGGKTSAFMAFQLRKQFPNVTFVFIFANTGQECEETLIFVDKCDKEFKLGVVWVEAVVNPIHGKGITHKVVDFKTASRNGEPFEAHIAKSGIPNANKPQCSDRLKKLVIEDYKKKNNLRGLTHCIGMRADEAGRVLSKEKRDRLTRLGMSDNQVKDFMSLDDNHKRTFGVMCGIPESIIKKFLTGYNLWYPLFYMGFDKQDVNTFWEGMPFTLGLEEHQGNCKTCWKKSDKKLWLLAIEEPEKFTFMRTMEDKYQHVKPNDDGKPRVFFRRHRSAEAICNEAINYDAATLRKMIGYGGDQDSGCSESCEAYSEDSLL